MNYQVKLEVFEGPFDLLLHLIEKNQLNIYDIPIALVTDQFLEYIKTMQLLSLTVAGEFLVVAATLMQIKARMLLPRPQVEKLDEETEEAEGEDPRAELVERLLEYKRFKDAAAELRQREEEWSHLYPRSGGEFPDQVMVPLADPTGGLSIWDLFEALRTILENLEPRPEIRGMPKEEVSVRDRMNEVIARLHMDGRLLFHQLFEKDTTKRAVITTFLAILELIRLRRITAAQEGVFSEIAITVWEGETSESY
jgi:segregation and condensation protein A